MAKRKILDYDGLQTYDSTIKEYIEAKTANLDNAVLTTAQELTDEQKAQARENIEVKPTDLVAKITNEYVSGTGLVYSCDTPFVDLWAAYEAGRDVFFNIVDMIFVKADFVITASQSDSEIKHVRASLINGANHQLYIVKEDDTVSFTTYSYITKSDMKQETGSSKVLPMSQKAVTDALALKADQTALDEAIDAIPQSDWNQNDETAKDYVQNRTHWEETVETPIVEETTFELVDGMGQLMAAQPLEVGQEYVVNLDGVQYNAMCKEIDLDGEILSYLGNLVAPFPDLDADTGELFFIAPMNSDTELGIMVDSDVTEHTVSVTCIQPEIHHIDPKYINDMYYEIPAVWDKVELIDDTWTTRATCKLASTPIEWAKDNQYRLRIDDVEYNFDGMERFAGVTATEMVDVYYIGASYIPLNSNMNFSEYPFCLLTTDFENIYAVFEDATLNHTVEFFESEGIINHLNPKYIKDMYYTSDPVEVELVPETTVEIIDTDFIEEAIDITLVEGNTYFVTWNEVQYTCVCYNYDGDLVIGNNACWDGDGGNGEPFLISNYDGLTAINVYEEGTYTVSISLMQQDIHQIDPKYIPDSVKTHDWNTMENRPFGVEIDTVAIVEEQTITLDSNGRGNAVPNYDLYNFVQVGASYTVEFDGVQYTGILYEDGDACYRTDFTTESGVDVYMWDLNGIVSSSELAGEHTIKISILHENITQIDDKFLPDDLAYYGNRLNNTIVNNAPVKSVNNQRGNVHLSASDVSAVPTTRKINNKQLNTDISLVAKDVDALPDCNAVGTGYLIMNVPENYTSDELRGHNSFMVGTGNVAGNKSMSVIGEYNANGIMCREIVSVRSTKIIKNNTFREYSGVQFIEDGIISPDGRLAGFFRADDIVTGGVIPTEGMMYGHEWTTTLSQYSEIISVDDEDDTYWYVTERLYSGEYTPDARQKYAHIVGNGTSNTARSNAYTLDWDGNAWFAGSVEGTALILLSPNGTRFNITVGDDGVLSTTEITE